MIIKNNYVVALFVFIGLVVAFNLASSYDNSVGNQVTGMALFGGSFSRITYLLQDVSNFIFSDILERTVIGSFILYGDVMIRLVIFIILYLIISNISSWGGLVKHEKYAKVISALIALISAVFIPQGVIYSIFGTPLTPGLFGGGLGLIFWGIAIFLPIYILFRWLKSSRERFSKFLIGFLFFGWLLVMGSVETRIAVLSYFTDLWDILIAFGSLACAVGFFLGIWKGFSSEEGAIRHRGGRERKSGSDLTNLLDVIRNKTIGDYRKNREAEGRAWGWQKAASAQREKIIRYYDNLIREADRKGKGPSEIKRLEERKLREIKRVLNKIR